MSIHVAYLNDGPLAIYVCMATLLQYHTILLYYCTLVNYSYCCVWLCRLVARGSRSYFTWTSVCARVSYPNTSILSYRRYSGRDLIYTILVYKYNIYSSTNIYIYTLVHMYTFTYVCSDVYVLI